MPGQPVITGTSHVSGKVCVDVAPPWTPLQISTLCHFIRLDPCLTRLEGRSTHKGAKSASRENLYTIALPAKF